MAVKYGEFQFPSDKGFTGSAGKQMVKAYARGGKVLKKNDGGYIPGTNVKASDLYDDADLEKMSAASERRPMKVPAKDKAALERMMRDAARDGAGAAGLAYKAKGGKMRGTCG